MRRFRSNRVCALVSFLIVCFSSCQIKEGIAPEIEKNGPVTVGIAAGGCATRTSLLSNGLSTVWSDGDELAVWALNSSDAYQLSAQKFVMYAEEGSRGWFTSTLDSAMPEGTYTYYACYPAPVSVSGTAATFSVSDVQDGHAGGGDDVLLATPVNYGPLTPIHDPDDHDMMSMALSHIMHHFRFFVPEGADRLDGEPIDKIVLTFPSEVVGDVVADLSDPSAALSLENGSAKLTLKLSEPLKESTSAGLEYADAVIFPQTFAPGQSFTVKTYSATKVATTDPVDLMGRTFAAGHSTPVRVLLTDVRNYCRINVNIAANHIGEDPTGITLTAPEGCRWGDNGSNVLVLSDPAGLPENYSLVLSYEEEEYYRAFSNQTIHVVYDCEHVTTSVDYRMPDMGSSFYTTLDLELPYLLFEDFSTVSTFSSSDNYTGGSNAGSKTYGPFLNGWSGGRIGGEAGKCIRIAARRETSARYGARVDSAPIIALKKASNLRVHFDYGINSQYGGLNIIMNGDVGQDCWIGYVTTADVLNSGSTTGTFEDGNHINAHVFTGSYDATPEDGDFILHDVPTGLVRISWRNMSEDRAGTTNTTNWFYLDNVRVSIAK